MGAIVGGVASLFGGRQRRREQKAANQEFNRARQSIQQYQFKDVGQGLNATGYDAATGQAPTLESLGLGGAAQAQVGQLGPAQGYESQGYESQGYTSTGFDAAQTNVAGLQRGADAGLTNTMNNLQVSTAAAEMAAQEADQSLAAQQDLAAQAGTGGGGATALAAAAAKSKAGIAAGIDKDIKRNEMVRAQAEGQLQKDLLAQENLASNFDFGQQRFNVGQTNTARQFTAAAENQAAQFGAQAANQAAQFGAQAANQAAQFGAQSQNQFALSQFDATNKMSMFNVGQQQDLLRDQYRAATQFGMQNLSAQNRAAEFGASSENQFALQQAKFAQDQQMAQYGQMQDVYGINSSRKASADQARRSATNALVGGIGGIIGAASGPLGVLLGPKTPGGN